MGEPVVAPFGLLGDGRTAAIEMAAASGLVLVPARSARSDGRDHARGTGELLLAAIAAGAQRVIVGIGGSATNDGGAGLGQALGYRLLDDVGTRARARRRQPGPAGPDRRLRPASRAGRASRSRSPATSPIRYAARGAPRPSTARRRARRPRWSRCSTPTSRTSPRSSSATWASRSATSRAPAPPAAWAAAWSPSPAGRLEPGINLVIEAVDLAGPPGGRRPLPDRRRGARRPERLRQDGRRRRPAGALARLPGAGPGRLDRPRRRGDARRGPRRLFLDLPRAHRPRGGHGPRRRAAGRGDGAGRAGVPGGAATKVRIGWPSMPRVSGRIRRRERHHERSSAIDRRIRPDRLDPPPGAGAGRSIPGPGWASATTARSWASARAPARAATCWSRPTC